MIPPAYDNIAGNPAPFGERPTAILARPKSGAERLAAFLAAAEPMLVRPSRQRTSVVADPAAFAKAMSAIAKPLSLARNVGVLADPWVLARLKRREVANAAVLAGLWRPASGGKIATEFLASFLDRLRSRPAGAALPDRASLAGGYLIRTEDRPMGDAADRVDITIEGRSFLLGVEVKIDAGLQPDQLGRYQASISRRAKDRGKQAAVIFLSLRRTTHSGVVQADWNDVAAAGRAVALERKATSTVNHHLIERFAAHVARF